MNPVRALVYIGIVVAAALFLASAAGCASGPTVRPCGHPGLLQLTANLVESPFPEPALPGQPSFPPGFGPLRPLPATAFVTVHNGLPIPVDATLACSVISVRGTSSVERRLEVPAEHEVEMRFSVPRDGLGGRLTCELVHFSF